MRTPGRATQVIAILIASGIAGALLYSYFERRVPPVPQRTLRIGFEPNPPFQIRTETGFGGLAVETIDAAARRAGLHLQWVETGTSSDEAFRKGLVDLWPLMADLPERRKRLHLSAPWVIGSHILLTRTAMAIPDRSFTGRIALFKLPLHIALVHSEFPAAQLTPLETSRDVLLAVCRGTTAAGFMEKRVAMDALRHMPPDCASVALRVQPLPDLTIKTCVASTFEAAGAAELLRREIGNLYRDGELAVTMSKYSFYGLDDAWATYDLMESAERTRWMTWGVAAFAIALTLACWQTVSLRQRKRAEAVLRVSEEQFRAIFQQAGVGVAQIGLDGKVEMANDRYCEVVGHQRRDLVGKGTVEITHREDFKEQLAMLPKLLAGEIHSFSTEKRYERQDGTVVWAEMCKSLVRDVQGEPKCFIAVVADISERKRAEAALKESEERFRTMADSAPVLIWVSGLDKLCNFFNTRWLEFTGRTLDQELGDGWVASVHPEDREGCFATYISSFDARHDFQREYRLRRADGEYRWVLDHGAARFSPGGAFAGYIGSCIDITDLKRSYEQHMANQKLESLGVLAAGVAHDFNNLLGAIVARAESAEIDIRPGSSLAEDVDQIRVTALRAAEIVSQLMTFARQETAPATDLDLSQLVGEMLDLLKVSIGKATYLRTQLASGLPAVRANPAEIRQVVMNLIINASEALEGKPGFITITTAAATLGEASSCAVRLEIKDTGSGMTADVKARIFDPFFTTRFVGRGLGLAAAQGIVRRHGGSIEVESTPGEGSRFTILLPCAAEGAVMDEDGNRQERPAAVAGTVLFVDDEEALRQVVAKLLRSRGFNVVEAPDGPSAIEILKSHPATIRVVLLDVTMPGMGGREVFEELRRIRPDLKVILSTAYTRETAMAPFGENAPWGFIRKPYRSEEVARVLEEALGAAAGTTES